MSQAGPAVDQKASLTAYDAVQAVELCTDLLGQLRVESVPEDDLLDLLTMLTNLHARAAAMCAASAELAASATGRIRAILEDRLGPQDRARGLIRAWIEEHGAAAARSAAEGDAGEGSSARLFVTKSSGGIDFPRLYQTLSSGALDATIESVRFGRGYIDVSLRARRPLVSLQLQEMLARSFPEGVSVTPLEQSEALVILGAE
jgi:hypothetical protein